MAFKIDYCPAIEISWGGCYCRRIHEARMKLLLYPTRRALRNLVEKQTKSDSQGGRREDHEN